MSLVRSALTAVQNFLNKATQVPPSEWLHAAKLFSVTRIKKGDYYWRQGEGFRRIGIMVRGLAAAQYEFEDGSQRIKRFLTSGDPVGPYPSIVTGEEVNYSMLCFEDSIFIHMAYQDWEKLLLRHRCWETITRKSLEAEVFEREYREYQLLVCSATERYENFLERRPEYETRLPQYAIASYLGITPVALSRIRKRRQPSS